MELILGALVVAFLFGPPVGIVVLFIRTRAMRAQIETLEKALKRQGATAPTPAPWAAEPSPPEMPEAPAAKAPAAETPDPAAPPDPAPPPARIPPKPIPAEPLAARAAGMEEALTSRWMVWLGAVAVALSAVFLFRYALDQGLLGPKIRLALGGLMGAALIAGGEWAHRRARPADPRPDYVPAALTGAGVFALFVSVYAAHALNGLIGPATAFGALCAVSFLALALALRQGVLIAVLALAGGYLVPGLIVSDTANAAPVFVYLTVLSTACLALMRLRDWWILGAAVSVGAFVWPVLWLLAEWSPADQAVLSAYALALAAAFAGLSAGWPIKRPETPALAWLSGLIADTSGLGFALSGALLVLLGMVCDHNAASMMFLGLYACMGIAFGLRRASFEGLAAAGAIVIAIAFIMWQAPAAISQADALRELGVESYASSYGPVLMPPELIVHARALAGFAALFGIGGLMAMRVGATPGVWAAIAGAMPLLLLTLGYWRIGGFEVNIGWAALAAGLSLFNLGAATLANRWPAPDRRAAPLSIFAAAATAALALALAATMREAWLTVALSLEVLALSWIWSRLRVPQIRAIIYPALAVIVVRLVLNPQVIEYQGGVAGLLSWVVYGYGMPAVALWFAARQLRADGPNLLATLCKSAAVGLAFMMVALQARVWTAGDLRSDSYDLLDQSVQTLWWLAAAWLLLRRDAGARAAPAWHAGAGLLALACTQIAFGHLIHANPLGTSDPVGDWPLVNLLGAAYLAPAVLLALIARDSAIALPAQARQALAGGAGLLGFVYLTLEVRRAFQGPVLLLEGHPPGGAEIYAYSAAWLAIALGLLGVGIVRRSALWRRASLAVMAITVLKVFLYDMSDLTGLYRVASFLGLGLGLIGIGSLYRRFVALDRGADEG